MTVTEQKNDGLCRLCPRACGADRRVSPGYCGAPDVLRVSRVSRHMYEEPSVSGKRGSGTVFFSGCSMGCVFCQNRELSRDCLGEDISPRRLAEIFLMLDASGVHNINLVTPTHYTDKICEALAMVKHRLTIPVAWNSSGYELPETIAMTEGLVDIYMPDFKYVSPELSEKFSDAPDYAEYAARSLAFMYKMLGDPVFDGNGADSGDPRGLLKHGVLVRHLVLPGCRKDSIEVLRLVARTVPADKVLLGLMSQYTPDFYSGDVKDLRRRVTTFEYKSVRDEALRLGFDGYMQDPASATTAFTPAFTGKLTFDLDPRPAP